MKKALIQKIEKNNLEKKRKKQSPCATRLEKPGQFAWLSSYFFVVFGADDISYALIFVF